MDKEKILSFVSVKGSVNSHTAILAGFAHATGDCMTMVAADLQEPLEIIIEMYEKWKQGKKVEQELPQNMQISLIERFFVYHTELEMMQELEQTD